MRSGQQQLYAFCVDDTIDTCTEQAFVFPICTETAGIRDTPQLIKAHIATTAIYPSNASPILFLAHQLCRTSLLLVRH
jgi:hypothetical protein